MSVSFSEFCASVVDAYRDVVVLSGGSSRVCCGSHRGSGDVSDLSKVGGTEGVDWADFLARRWRGVNGCGQSAAFVCGLSGECCQARMDGDHGTVESGVGVGSGGRGGLSVSPASCSGVVSDVSGVKSNRQRKKEERERRRKERRRQEKLKDGEEVCVADSVGEVMEGHREVGSQDGIPEWRRRGSVSSVKSSERGKFVSFEQGRKGGRFKSAEVRRREERMRLSKFAGCDESVKKELLESQAKRYIAENNAAVVKANEQARRVTAVLKAGVPERNVEVQRLQLDKRMNKLAEEYMKDDDGVSRVKTVLSEGLEDVIAVPVMAEGSSVSPDSSISVAQLNKMIKLIHGQASENEELRKAMGKLGIDDSGIASATSAEPVLSGYGFFPAEDDLAHQLEFYSDY